MPDLSLWEWLGVAAGAVFWLLSLFDPPEGEFVRLNKRVWGFWRRW
jgi:hypothetical protein